jgi:hypothetical protein
MLLLHDIQLQWRELIKFVSDRGIGKVVFRCIRNSLNIKDKIVIPGENKFFPFIIVFFIFLTGINSNVEGQKKYYFSSTDGNDFRTLIQAQNPATPFQTLNRLSSLFAEGISPGDSILFKRGDTFFGSIAVTKSGADSAPIVFSAYGTGPKPVITGFSVISSWTPLGSNIYEAVVPGYKEAVNCVVINGEVQPIGRFPKASAANGGYLIYESHSGDSQITDNQLTDLPNWTGGEIILRKNNWVIDRTNITSHTGSILNFTPVTTFYKLIDKSGYFFQNHLSALIQNGDWCYDKTSKKIRIYYSTAPPDVKVSTVDQLLTVISRDFIKVSDISFEGANTKTVYAYNVESMTIDNCTINFSGIYGAHLASMKGDFQFINSTISNSLNYGIVISGRYYGDRNCTIKNNIITNTGIIAGMGGSGDGGYIGISISTENGAVIENNAIKNTGYIPINFSGNNILIMNNIIDNYLLIKQDGGAIYTWNGGYPVKMFTNRVIKGNIISNGIGNGFGVVGGKPGANGIYMDNSSNHVEIIDNTVFNMSGIGYHNNSPFLITMTGNTFFNVARGYDIVRYVMDGEEDYHGNEDIIKMDIRNNIFFSITDQQTAFKFSDKAVNFPTASTIKARISAMGIFDNNYYHLFNDQGFSYSYRNDKTSPWINPQPLSFENWKSYTGFEENGKLLPSIHNIKDSVRFEYNPAKTIKNIPLDTKYYTADNKIYTDSVTLQPYSSVILMKYRYNLAPIIRNQSFKIPEKCIVGDTIGTVVASDPDPDQTIIFSIVSGNSNGAFSIDANSGVITVLNVTALGNNFKLIVRVQDNGIGNLSSQATISLDLVVGIEFIGSSKTIKVYPNPVADELIIEADGNSELLSFQILDSTGHVIFEGSLSDKTVVQAANFSPGVYLLKILDRKVIIVKKILKE